MLRDCVTINPLITPNVKSRQWSVLFERFSQRSRSLVSHSITWIQQKQHRWDVTQKKNKVGYTIHTTHNTSIWQDDILQTKRRLGWRRLRYLVIHHSYCTTISALICVRRCNTSITLTTRYELLNASVVRSYPTLRWFPLWFRTITTHGTMRFALESFTFVAIWNVIKQAINNK